MSRKMFGVVLWADRTDQKAVIWCEDHGDLAYWHEPETSLHDGTDLDVGDLVQFDMTQGDNLRHARNPERLESKQFFGLAQSLRDAGEPPVRALPEARIETRAEAQVIAFPGARGPQRSVA